MRREFAQLFSNEVVLPSCDMNKLKVGGSLMVSRYHQMKKFFMDDDAPDHNDDHDYNLQGNLITPSGHIVLEFKKNILLEDQLCSDNIYQEVNFDIDDDEIFIKDYSNIRMEEDVKVLLNDLAE